MKTKTQEFFDRFQHIVIILFIAKRDKKDERVQEYKKKEEELMQEINNSDVQEIFMNLLIAEYKEMYYESIFFPHFKHDEYLHMEELERVILEYYGENVFYEHEHDPTHFMYDDGKHHYMFYERVEHDGRSIFDELIDD